MVKIGSHSDLAGKLRRNNPGRGTCIDDASINLIKGHPQYVKFSQIRGLRLIWVEYHIKRGERREVSRSMKRGFNTQEE